MYKEAIKKLEKCTYFEHYISLGHCCYIAIELQKLGLRDSSMPFDWVRTRWFAIETFFKHNFKNYLDYDQLYQKKNSLHSYKNLDYGVGFFHDFVDYKSLKSQIADVQKKYERRIARFFNHIKSPTLFIRYLWDYDELVYISQHYAEIEKMIKEHNTANEIIFISHDSPQDIDISKIKFMFFITKDEDEELNEKPLSSCKELYDYLSNVHYEKRDRNLRFNENKNHHSKTVFSKLITKFQKKYEKVLKSKTKKYIHNKQC